MSFPSLLVGRSAELAWIERMLDVACAHRGTALLVSGEAGVGKSRLLEETRAHAEARGFRTLTTAGAQTEADLPFAGLHRLLRPVLSAADGLPGRQRDAILAAFGLSDGSASDLFLVGLAALTLLADLAAQSPLLILVEDAQWLDRASLDVIGFVARRVEDDAIMVLAAARDGVGAEVASLGLEELRLGPLGDEDASALLALRAPDLTERAKELVLANSSGNPLALVELPVALSAVSDLTPPAGPMPVTVRLERAFADRVDDLPTETQRVLLLC